jgi:hypothetical protein
MSRRGGNPGARADAPAPTIAALTVADPPDAWEAIGFDVSGSRCCVGTVTVELAGADAGEGIVGWAVRDTRAMDLDGLLTEAGSGQLCEPATHPNSVTHIDHIVVSTPSLDRTAAALDDIGVRLRRERAAGTPEAPLRQGFFRMGEVILEVVAPVIDGPAPPDAPGPSQSDPARFWGMVFVVEDLDRCAALLGEHLGAPRDAVQPGRRIATLRRSAGLSVPVAFITPAPARVS